VANREKGRRWQTGRKGEGGKQGEREKVANREKGRSGTNREDGRRDKRKTLLSDSPLLPVT
jgi:hypothetical protein